MLRRQVNENGNTIIIRRNVAKGMLNLDTVCAFAHTNAVTILLDYINQDSNRRPEQRMVMKLCRQELGHIRDTNQCPMQQRPPKKGFTRKAFRLKATGLVYVKIVGKEKCHTAKLFSSLGKNNKYGFKLLSHFINGANPIYLK